MHAADRIARRSASADSRRPRSLSPERPDDRMTSAARRALRRRHAARARARRAGPGTGVNPQVGCVLLDAAGTIVAEGWHRGAGTPHAEVDALPKLAASGATARGLTAVVTLEPCNHTGRTGPCCVALIEAGVARVVYAVTDPGHRSGGGAERLRDAGVEVAPACSPTRSSASCTLAHRRAPRPPVRHRQVGVEPRRPRRRSRRHEPVDHRHRRAAARARAARRERRDPGRHRHRARRRPVPHRARRRRRAARRTSRSRSSSASARCRRMPHCAATRPGSSRPAAATSRAVLTS